jgi:biopolymer transport protein ExbD
MAFGGFEGGERNAPMADINMTPLIDVMLVLLVIFIITAPLLTRAVKLDLPHASAVAAPDTAQTIDLSIDARGTLYWNGASLDEATLRARLTQAGREHPAPEIHLRADRATRYDTLARVMADAQRAGVTRIGFVTLPDAAQSDAAHPEPAMPGGGTPTGPAQSERK